MAKETHFYLVRGLIREKGHWGPFIQQLQASYPRAKISALDLPGAGEHYKGRSPLTIGAMVDEMRQDFLKAQDPSRHSHLIAISLGGMIAVEWLRRYPGDFQSATLINTSFGGVSPVFHRLKPRAFFFLLKVPFLKGRRKEARILQLVSNNAGVFQETLAQWEVIQRERPVSLGNTLRQLLAAATFRIGNFLPSLPVTLLAATRDRMVSIECSRAIARRWRLPLREHPSGGHDLTVDDPQWVAQNIGVSSAECEVQTPERPEYESV